MKTSKTMKTKHSIKEKKHNINHKSSVKAICKHPATFHGLIKWYEHMFEHLGWMILAKSKGGMNDKIVSYKKSLERLEEKLSCKIDNVGCPYKKQDLLIMLDNVKILSEHVMKEL